MKINNKMISIPPYISTSWNYVDGLYMKGATLVITLFGGESVNVPGLKPEIIEAIFVAHAESLEEEITQNSVSKTDSLLNLPFNSSLFSQAMPLGESAFQFGVSSMDGLGAMQHNPAQADAPDLPLEILQKIGAIVKIVAPEEVVTNTAPVQDCNCPHCQITRALSASNDEIFSSILHSKDVQPEVAERFQIQQCNENLYTVIDTEIPSRPEFKVFLGSPVGCTCGEEKCKHIVAVLQSYA